MIDKKEFPIPVAVVGLSIVYTCLKPSNTGYDGYISQDGVDTPIYVYSLYLRSQDGAIGASIDKWRLIDTTEFHKQFWEMPSRSEKMDTQKWIAMFSTRSEPISPDILTSVGVKPEDIYGNKQKMSPSATDLNAETNSRVVNEQKRLRTALYER